MPEEAVKVLLAILAGGLIGLEREYRDKSAGFRTMVFICVGATVFTIMSSKIGELAGDPTRIASNIVSGVGFLGAGVIMRDGGRVAGMTTAAIIWLVAGIGMTIGAGYYEITSIVSSAVLVVLWIFPAFEARIDRLRENRVYTISSPLDAQKLDDLKTLFTQCGLRIEAYTVSKTGSSMTSTWVTIGSSHSQYRAMSKLLEDDDIEAFQT